MKRTAAIIRRSCTAGRAAFITGQSPIRTWLTKFPLPSAALGLQKEDPTVADFPKNPGCTTGHFGNNHLGNINLDEVVTNLQEAGKGSN